MTARYKTRAFVFKKNDVNEADRVFSVFTDKFGKIDISAKAIRKITSKLRSGIDIFFVSDIEFIQGKNKKTLTDAVAVEKFNDIYQNSDKFKIANNIGKILNSFIRGEEKDENIFSLLNEILLKLNNTSLKAEKYRLLYYYFLWNILSLLGYLPEVNKCNLCKEELFPSGIYFSSRLGGVICGDCIKFKKPEGSEPCRRINPDVVKILRLIFKKDWQTISRLKIEMASEKLFWEVSENAILSFSPRYN
jgi:DNA repair protein RecO (recombination protein O)